MFHAIILMKYDSAVSRRPAFDFKRGKHVDINTLGRTGAVLTYTTFFTI
jgi:hypothetical protein